ncbi:MAG: hypothetical protein AB7E21_19010 [Pseudodonghicola sp.]
MAGLGPKGGFFGSFPFKARGFLQLIENEMKLFLLRARTPAGAMQFGVKPIKNAQIEAEIVA